jgi:transposase InsO family protein
MKLHANAALSLNRRRLLVERIVENDWSLSEAARAAEVSEPTARKWAARYLADGEGALLDRPSAAHRVHNRTPEDRIEAICALRRLRFTGAEIAELLAMPETTVSGILTRCGLGRLGRLGLEPATRYERSGPGELVHIDVRKLGRIERGAGHRATGKKHYTSHRADGAGVRRGTAGWEFVHVCVDDATRLAYAEVLADESAPTAVAFLRRGIRFFARYGVRVERVMTDNGSAYRSAIHAIACRALGIRHLRTRPYRPQTNGKAERFIRTMLGGWAYGAVYRSSAERAAALEGWLWRYNFKRPHGSLGRKTPAARLHELNNPLGSYTRGISSALLWQACHCQERKDNDGLERHDNDAWSVRTTTAGKHGPLRARVSAASGAEAPFLRVCAWARGDSWRLPSPRLHAFATGIGSASSDCLALLAGWLGLVLSGRGSYGASAGDCPDASPTWAPQPDVAPRTRELDSRAFMRPVLARWRQVVPDLLGQSD